ncbi:MAG: hypothetical protein GF333_06170 [Candidatus Omnitrophica bacterium]|nr:hypothetical protein [Candidatus Omnitrophota bacterium]
MNQLPNDYSSMSARDAEKICEQIRLEAETQIHSIRERAERDAENVRRQARAAAGEKRNEMLSAARSDLEKLREKNLSSLHLEKRRAQMEQKSAYARLILEEVKRRAREFREDPGYRQFLREAILEGAKVIDRAQLHVRYAVNDAPLFDSGFRNEVSERIHDQCGKPVVCYWEEGQFQDLGVVLEADEGRLRYDNRFQARLQRQYDDIYMELLREAEC